jgi:hypothetical protein
MTLTIIAGTHTFVDLTGKFRTAWLRSLQTRIIHTYDGVSFAKHRFDRVEILKDGTVIKHPRLINPIDVKGYKWTVNQPTGSCKTVLAVYNLARVWARGGNIAANLSFEYMPHNIGKPKEQWTPNLTCIDDFMKLKKVHATLDDIKGTADNWHSEESELIGQASNIARKEGVNLDITTQGVTNFVAPNIRRVTTGYEIPYCTIRDQRLPSPDGRGYPRLIEVISLIPGDMQIGDIFVGFGAMNNDIPDGRQITPSPELLNSYKSMEIATGLKAEGKTSNRPGLEGEEKLMAYLKLHYPDVPFKLKNGKGIFDIESPHALLDHVGIEEQGQGYRLNTRHKNIAKHREYSQLHKIPGYIVYAWNNDYRFLSVNSSYTLSVNPMINTGMLKASRSRIAIFG